MNIKKTTKFEYVFLVFAIAGCLFCATSALAADAAQFMSQSVPSSMVAGQTYSVSVTMKNTGTTTWTAAANYRLGSQNAQDNNTWGSNRAYLASSDSIAPNNTKTFTFNIAAPWSSGNYNFQWKMLQEGVQWFGEQTANVSVQVTLCAPNAVSGCRVCNSSGSGWTDHDDNCSSGQTCSGGICSSVSAREHYTVTQYWGWLGDDVHAAAVGWDGVTDGTPSVGAEYYSGDPAVAEQQLQQMKAAGINAVSFGWVNQKEEGPVWYDVNPDQAFHDGMMQAPSFDDLKFAISYDLATRAHLVYLSESGAYLPRDMIPGINFNDPSQATTEYPSYDFSLQDNGKYIYDELLSHDFDYMAQTYFNQSNYLKIGGKNVVYIYDTWRFHNGQNNPDLVNGFARALNRVRTEVYDNYGITLYLVGDFAKYGTTYWQIQPAGDSRTLSEPQDYRDWGYLQQFDAVGSWNNFQGLSNQSLSDYTDAAQDMNAQWRTVALSANRDYREQLTGSVKTAYGSGTTRLDYVPALVFSFRSIDPNNVRNFWSQATDTSEVLEQVSMVKTFRDSSVLAEENSDMVYQVAWNQWGEGQIIESSVEDNNSPYPGKYGNRYLDAIKNVLYDTGTKANGQQCFDNVECVSHVCSYTYCVPDNTYCGGVVDPMYFTNGATASNQWLTGVCRNGVWKTVTGGVGCDTFACDVSTDSCASNTCVAKKANGQSCANNDECSSNVCSYTYCVPDSAYCGAVEPPYYFANGATADNQWLFGICRSGVWKTVSGGIGCNSFACDSGTAACSNNACVTSGDNRANGTDCTTASQCASGICNSSFCVPSTTHCGGIESPMSFADGVTANNAWANGICRNGVWKIVTGGIGCSTFACDSGTCSNNTCQ